MVVGTTSALALAGYTVTIRPIVVVYRNGVDGYTVTMGALHGQRATADGVRSVGKHTHATTHATCDGTRVSESACHCRTVLYFTLYPVGVRGVFTLVVLISALSPLRPGARALSRVCGSQRAQRKVWRAGVLLKMKWAVTSSSS